MGPGVRLRRVAPPRRLPLGGRARGGAAGAGRGLWRGLRHGAARGGRRGRRRAGPGARGDRRGRAPLGAAGAGVPRRRPGRGGGPLRPGHLLPGPGAPARRPRFRPAPGGPARARRDAGPHHPQRAAVVLGEPPPRPRVPARRAGRPAGPDLRGGDAAGVTGNARVTAFDAGRERASAASWPWTRWGCATACRHRSSRSPSRGCRASSAAARAAPSPPTRSPPTTSPCATARWTTPWTCWPSAGERPVRAR